MNISAVLAPTQIRLKARQVKDTNFEVDADDFLNSFFLNDLGRLIGEAESGNLSEALLIYLAPDEEIETQRRQDVRSSIELLWNNLDSAIRNRVNHQQFKPAIIDNIPTLGKAYFEWRKRDSLLSRKIDSEQLQHDTAETEADEQKRQTTPQEQRVDKLTADLGQQETRLAEQRRSLAEMSSKLGIAFREPIPGYQIRTSVNSRRRGRMRHGTGQDRTSSFRLFVSIAPSLSAFRAR